MRKGMWIVIAVLLSATICSAQALADYDDCYGGNYMRRDGKMTRGMRGRMDKRMDLDDMFFYKVSMIKENAAELGISDDQMQKVKMLKSDVKKSMIKSDADVEILVMDIEEMLMKDEVDVAGVSAIIDKKYDMKSMAAKSLVAAYADLKKLLTKDQMKKLGEIWKKDRMDDRGRGSRMDRRRDMRRDMKN